MQLLKSGRPRVDTTVTVDQGCPKLSSNMREAIQMGFVNEVASDEDIEKYSLPFSPGTKCYWTRDVKRDFYLWGKISKDYAREYPAEGRFTLFLKDKHILFVLQPGDGSRSFKDKPFRIVWKAVLNVQPSNISGLDSSDVISVLKEALTCFGYDGRKNLFVPHRVVSFEF